MPTEDELLAEITVLTSQKAALASQVAVLTDDKAALAAALAALQDTHALLLARLASIAANHRQANADLWANHQAAIDSIGQALMLAATEAKQG